MKMPHNRLVATDISRRRDVVVVFVCILDGIVHNHAFAQPRVWLQMMAFKGMSRRAITLRHTLVLCIRLAFSDTYQGCFLFCSNVDLQLRSRDQEMSEGEVDYLLVC
jgi:hypothetical protein